MLKKVIILVMLSSILLVLVLVRAHTVAPVNNTSTLSNDSARYITMEYILAILMVINTTEKVMMGQRSIFLIKASFQMIRYKFMM